MATETSVAAPGSPTFTNPDMILPPQQQPFRDTPSPPVSNATLQRMSSINGTRRRSILDKPGVGPRLPVVAARPSGAGSWHTESSDSPESGQLSRRTSLRPVQEASSARRMSRTGSLRASWQRTPSKDRLDGGRTSSSLLGSGRRPSLAERLEEEEEPDSPYTTTSESTNAEDENDDDIGSKAEEILANAKKRLTAMEGNLSRARSLSVSRSGSAASTSGDSSSRLSRRISRSTLGSGGGWTVASSKQRQNFTGQGSGHLRVFSETAAPVQRPSVSPVEQRSMSALGHGATVGSPGHRNDWTDTSSSGSFSNGGPRYLEPLQEDELGVSYDNASSQESPYIRHQPSSPSIYQTPQGSSANLSRARSSIALRDLQEGVADLSGKVAQLRENTRRDSLKRQSLQRLKTPSPFTHADSWDEARDRESKMSTDTAVRVSITTSTPPIQSAEFAGAGQLVDEPLSASSIYSFKSPVSQFRMQHGLDKGDSPLLPVHPKIRHIPPTPTTPLRRHGSNQSTDSNPTADEFESPISPSVSNAFPAPPDTAPTPPRSRSNSAARSRPGSLSSIGRHRSASNASMCRSRSGSAASNTIPPAPLSHEDNPEAFDYSRFLLDSAMGTYKMDRSRSRSPSTSSNATASTTRPRDHSTARLSKISNASATSRASTARRISPSPNRLVQESDGSSGTGQTIAQRRASNRSGRSNSSTSLRSVSIPDGKRSVSPRLASEASSPPSTLSPPAVRPPTHGRPSHLRQGSVDSVSASSVASFATALERASSRLTVRSQSRTAMRSASTNGKPVPTHRAGLEAYDSAKNQSLASLNSMEGDEDDIDTMIIEPVETFLADLPTPTLPPEQPEVGNAISSTLSANVRKASSAILSAVLAVSQAAVREDDEKRGIAANGTERSVTPRDEEMLGRVLEGVLHAAVGLIGQAGPEGPEPPPEHGRMGNSWRESSFTAGKTEIDESAVEQAREIWRMRCEVARRALSEEKPGEGF